MNDDVLKQLITIEGHINGIEQMVENGSYCNDVIKQIRAVQAVLENVSSNILDDHLHSYLITTVRGEDPSERERVLSEMADIFEMKIFA